MSVSAQGRRPGLGLGRLGAACSVVAGLLVLTGCSAETSRFDYPVFSTSQSASEADRVRTASLPPVPAASVYAGRQPVERPVAPPQHAPIDAVESRPIAAPDTPQAMPIESAPPLAPRQAPPRQATPPAAPVVAARPPTRPMPEPASKQAPTSPATATVERGDTLLAISRRHGVTVDAIMRANDLTSHRIDVGQTLVIPGGAAPPAPVTHTVERGESLYMIARKHNIDHAQLAAHNGITGTTIQPGQVLTIPGAGTTVALGARPEPAGVRVVRTRPVQGPQRAEPEPEPVRVAAAGSMPMPQASPARGQSVPTPREVRSDASAEQPTRLAALPQPQARTDAPFRWPVRGRIVSGFGPKPDGRHNDGINIAVPLGTEVKAAENGVVAYAGNELEGYGNLILIRHSDGWVSAYAHNDAMLVKRGDRIERGQVIARAGQTGSVSQPQLHFELRKGSKPVDPVQYLAQN